MFATMDSAQVALTTMGYNPSETVGQSKSFLLKLFLSDICDGDLQEKNVDFYNRKPLMR